MKKIVTIPALILAAAGLTACATGSVPTASADLGPMKYDASGTIPCSARAASYDQACGFRVVRKADGAAEIWISNIAYHDEARYRVLYFARGEFSTRDEAKLDYSRDSDNWLVSANGNEFYKIPDAVIAGG